MSWFGLGPSSTLDVVLTNVEGRLRIDNDGSVTDAPLTSSSSAPSSKDGSSGPQPPLWIYSTGESVEGEARIDVPPGKKVEHMGIRVELKGVVGECCSRAVGEKRGQLGPQLCVTSFSLVVFSRAELFGDKAGGHEFVSWVRELSGPGILQPGRGVFRFLFPKLELPYESYDGINAKCRYYVRVTVAKSGSFVAAGGMLKEQELIVRNALGPQGEPNFSSSALVSPSATAPVADSSVKLEVGIEDCLHIEFEYDRTRFALSSEGDTITGRLSFLLVRIAIKYAEIALIRRETAGPGEYHNHG